MRVLHKEPVSNTFIDMSDIDDAMHIIKDGQVAWRNTIVDPYDPNLYDESHRDAMQIIKEGLLYRERYALGVLNDVFILQNHIRSFNKLQCIFSSDGIHRNLRIHDNMLQTEGRHFISIAGLENGSIKNNCDQNGIPAHILLVPARIAGNPKGAGGRPVGNDWIMTYKDNQHVYCDTQDIIRDYDHIMSHHPDRIIDKRFDTVPRREGDRYWFNFDANGFRERCAVEKPSPLRMKMLITMYGTQAS